MSQEGGAPPVSLGVNDSSLNSSSLLRFIRQGRSFSGHEEHCCFLNSGKDRFADVSAAARLNVPDDGRAVGCVDWDLDGDLDLWITNRNGPQLRFLRNGLSTGHHFVAIRLRGTDCNRDAIGARVELVQAGDRPKLIRTLRAGDGYLAQSSKWLHFGLGDHPRIERVVVQWPGGGREEFQHVTVDRRCELVQGTAKATLWQPEKSNIQLANRPAPTSEDSDAVHVFSVSRVPVPRLPYRGLDDTTAEVFEPGSGKPVLLNVWASWCGPCLDELAEFAASQAEIQSAGLQVVALSVDGIDGQESVSPEKLSGILQRVRLSCPAGRADPGLIEKLQLLNNHLFDLHLPLPVPTSVLIDGQGRLAALYKGRVPLQRVLADVAAIDQDVNRQRGRTTPFPGRWHEPLGTIPLVPLLDALTSGGFLLEADDYVKRLGTVPKQALLPAIVRLGMACYRRGLVAQAQEHFRVAVKIDPTFVGVELQLGELREQQGQPEAAAHLYREALRRNAQSVRALNNLAWLLATCPTESIRRGPEAVELAKQANELTNNEDASILDTLAAAYAESGAFASAREAAQRALQIAESRGRLALAAKIKTRLELYGRDEPFRASK